MEWHVSRRRIVRKGRARSVPVRVESLEGRCLLASLIVTTPADAGVGSLRAAIELANQDPAPDTITFDPAVVGTITLTSALPDLSSMSIQGPGASVLSVARSDATGTPEFRIVTVPAGSEVVISGLTISGGSVTGSGSAGGGGIINNGTVSVANCVISENTSSLVPLYWNPTGYGPGWIYFGGSGGGISNRGAMELIGCTIRGNKVYASNGGGISNTGLLNIANCTLADNMSTGTKVQDGGGGAISNFGTLAITNSTLSGNSATGVGGAIQNGGPTTENIGGEFHAALLVTSCTFMANTAATGSDIVSARYYSKVELPIYYLPPGVPVVTRYRISDVTAYLSISSSLVATTPGDAGKSLVSDDGNVTSLGHNIFSDTPDAVLDPTDLVNTNPMLGPLQDNGGPTFTHALLPGSPAIDGGGVVAGLTTDQRGLPRSRGNAPDIGAFEFDFSRDTPPVVPTEPVDSTGPVVLRHYLLPSHRPGRVVLKFSETLNPATATNLANYRIVTAGRDGRIGTRDDYKLAVRSAVYHPETGKVRLMLSRRLKLCKRFLLTVRGTAPGGVTDMAGNLLDGDRNGQPGGNVLIRRATHRAEKGLGTNGTKLAHGSGLQEPLAHQQ